MLIQALCDYYDVLEKNGNVLKEGYSKQAVHALIALSPDGEMESMIDYQKTEVSEGNNGKMKEKKVPRVITMPYRTEKSGICSNIVEHRPTYIFGLNYEKNEFTPFDKTDKAKKSYQAFRERNLEFLEGLDSPIINAYRNFILRWVPENETENPLLVNLGNKYKNTYFAFCLSGHPNILLHKDSLILDKWEQEFVSQASAEEFYAQCAITGEHLPIARVHNKIKGISGGLATGTVLIGYKGSAGCSYGNEQSYNSNISTVVMKKYTYALNTLLSEQKHRTVLDDMTVIYWAIGGKHPEECEAWLSSFLLGNDDKMNEEHTEKMLGDLFKKACSAKVTKEELLVMDEIDKQVNFYMVGFKPNASRISMKFIYRRNFADILWCMAQHQKDMQIFDAGLQGEFHPISIWRLKNEMKSSEQLKKEKKESKQSAGDAALLSAIFKAVLYETRYPAYLLSTMVTRAKTDKYINRVRAGTIKAYINRELRISGKKEEITVGLDKNNENQAYLCGRLFAVLERIQRNAASSELNRTIKDAYFASAASKPALVFPKLLALSNHHMKQIDKKESRIFFSKLMNEIIEKLEGQFPDTLLLVEQGKFMIGYYHQEQDFYKKAEK